MPAINRCSVATASPAKRLVSRVIPGIQRAGVVKKSSNRKRLKAQPCSQRTYQELKQNGEDMMDWLHAIAKGSQTNLFVDHILPALAFSAISEGASAGIGNAFKGSGGYWKELGRASAHGTSNGLIRMAQGGKFEHGFFAGFVSSGVGSLHISGNVWANTAISSSVGGASEAIGGGKFMNGAITGAYTYLFNHAAHFGNSTGETGGPSERPSGQVPWDLNGDGKLQKNEADFYWVVGGGVGISVDNSTIDWTGLKTPADVKVGEIFPINTTDAFLILPFETAATYGGTSFIVRGAHTVEVIDQSYHYNFRANNSAENIARNIMNWLGRPVFVGTNYKIHYNNPLITIK